GKFLKEIRPSSQGWDGTLDGTPVPATDYWFEVFYKENGVEREFKSHFSLKR
ncbi:MAG: T9SS type B sorting domain-containing protein, partial [Bacteroidetes bacterium]|nr:T9SS type B sorting domain-containing protein [Bacteroidota bacterium]